MVVIWEVVTPPRAMSRRVIVKNAAMIHVMMIHATREVVTTRPAMKIYVILVVVMLRLAMERAATKLGVMHHPVILIVTMTVLQTR